MKSQEADVLECGHRLRRKVVICEVEDDRQIQVRHVLETSGFNCAPQIKYGEINDSKIWIDKKTTACNGSVFIKLMTPSILQLCI